jgi:hypothetical protein
VKVDVYTIEADEEVDEGFLLLSWNVSEEGRRDDFAGGEGLVDGDVEDESFSVDVADIDTTFVSEEDGVTLALGVDTDVVLGVCGMRQERLDDKVV